MPDTSDFLDLRVSQQARSYRFDVLDNRNRVIGEVHPAWQGGEATPPTVTHDATRTIARDMAGLSLVPSEASGINPLTDRIRPWLIVEDGAEFPLGIFMFADALTPHRSWGDELSSTLVDQTLILEQAVDRTVGVPIGDAGRATALALLDDVGITAIVDVALEPVGAPMSWPGGTSRRTILADIAAKVGWYPPFFNNEGVCRLAQVVHPDTPAVADVTYGDGTVYAESMTSTNGLLKAPNRTIAISSDATSQAWVGIYDVPATAPHSFFNRGFRVVEVFNVEGIGSQSEIDGAARTLATTDGPHRTTPPSVETMTFFGAPNPLHDGYSIVEVRGSRWVEQSWTTPLTPSGPMTHTVRKVE